MRLVLMISSSLFFLHARSANEVFLCTTSFGVHYQFLCLKQNCISPFQLINTKSTRNRWSLILAKIALNTSKDNFALIQTTLNHIKTKWCYDEIKCILIFYGMWLLVIQVSRLCLKQFSLRTYDFCFKRMLSESSC